jgi:hypothetical protein
VARNVDVDILEVVDARAAYRNPFVSHGDRDSGSGARDQSQGLLNR